MKHPSWYGHVAPMVVALAFAPGCSSLPGNVDALSAVERADPGLPILSLRWRFEVAKHKGERKPQEFASAVVYSTPGASERLFVGSHDGVFYSLSADKGTVQWKIKLGSVSARPVVYRGNIYVGTDDGKMLCLNTVDGSEIWRYGSKGAVLQSPVIANGLVLFSNESDQVHAIDLDTGKYRWLYKTDTPEEYTLRGHAGVAYADGLAFTGFSTGTMVALRAETGTVAWMTSLKGKSERFVDVDGTPVIVGETVYVSSSGGGVYALDKATGLIRWHTPIENAGSLVADGQRLYVAAAEQGVYALDTAGHIVWRQGTRGGGEPAPPLISGEYLLYTLSEDGMFVADKQTGEVHQYFDPGTGVSSTPTVWHDQMYVLSNGGILYAMNVHRF